MVLTTAGRVPFPMAVVWPQLDYNVSGALVLALKLGLTECPYGLECVIHIVMFCGLKMLDNQMANIFSSLYDQLKNESSKILTINTLIRPTAGCQQILRYEKLCQIERFVWKYKMTEILYPKDWQIECEKIYPALNYFDYQIWARIQEIQKDFFFKCKRAALLTNIRKASIIIFRHFSRRHSFNFW